MWFWNTPLNLAKVVENGWEWSLKLTVYYDEDTMQHYIPWSVTMLQENCHVITVNGNSQWGGSAWEDEKNKQLLEIMSHTALIPTNPENEKSSYLDARIYYVFQSKITGRVFTVALDGYNYDKGIAIMVVNGKEVEYNEVFFEVVEPFLNNYSPIAIG